MEGKSILGLIIVVAIIGSFIPIFNVKEPYEAKETYETEEPYQVEVAYQDTEPYETPIKYVVDSAKLTEEGILDVWAYSNIVVRNIDDTGGTFIVTHKFYNINGLVKQLQTQAFIPAGGSYKFRAGYDKQFGENVKSGYSVIEPTKTAYRVVTKYKYETRYRTVTKERTVTKYRDKKVSLIEILFG